MKRNLFWGYVIFGIFGAAILAFLLYALSACGRSEEISEIESLQNSKLVELHETSGSRSSAGRVIKPDAVDRKEGEIFYDDGTEEMQHSPWVYQTGGQLAVAFTPAFHPIVLTKVRFFVIYGGIPTTKFRVRVYGGTAAAGPDGKDLLTSEVTASASSGYEWVEVDLSDQNVAMEWLTAPGDRGSNAQFLGVDTSSDPNRRSWWKVDSSSDWKRLEHVAGIGDRNLMIRATVSKK